MFFWGFETRIEDILHVPTSCLSPMETLSDGKPSLARQRLRHSNGRARRYILLAASPSHRVFLLPPVALATRRKPVRDEWRFFSSVSSLDESKVKCSDAAKSHLTRKANTIIVVSFYLFDQETAPPLDRKASSAAGTDRRMETLLAHVCSGRWKGTNVIQMKQNIPIDSLAARHIRL